MMTRIKFAICFLLGSLYTSCVWLLIQDGTMNTKTWILSMTLVISTMVIFGLIIKFFVDYWKKR